MKSVSRRGLRRPLAVASWLFYLLVIVELVSFAGFWVADGQPFTYGRLSAERAARARPAEGEGAGAPAEMAEEYKWALHPYVGYVLHPRISPRLQRLVNSYGFADDKPSVQKRSDEKVIVGIIGGSVAFYTSTKAKAAFIEELRQSERFGDKEIVLVRLAQGGYKQPQHLMAVNYILALGGEFDYIVNIDGFNEVVIGLKNYWTSGAPFLPMDWESAVQKAPDLEYQRLVGRVVYLRDERRRAAERFSQGVAPYSISLQLLWRTRDGSIETALAEAQQELDTYAGRPEAATLSGPAIEEPEVLGELVDVWARSSIQLARLCQANGIRYLHFLQPNQYVPGSKPMAADERRVAIQGAYEALARPGYEALLATSDDLRAEGVDFHDLTMLFSEVREPLYVDACCHLNTLGYEILAREVARTMTEGSGDELRP